jgi:hypothetical protein
MRMSPRIDYCLVSDQPAPNLLPYLDSRFRPQGVVLVVSPEMDRRVAPLQNVFRGVLSVELLRVPNAYDFSVILQRIRDHSRSARERGFATWLNITGGTKPMAIAAYTAFEEGRVGRVYYLNVKTNQLTWYGEQSGDPSVTLDTRIDLPLFLAANGYTIVEGSGLPPDSRHLAFAERVGASCVTLIGELRLVNAMLDAEAKRAAKQPAATDLPANHRSGLERLLTHAIDCNLGRWNGDYFEPNDDGDREVATWQLLRGRWLEWYVYSVMRSTPQIALQDIAAGVKISDQAENENELDVAALIGDRLVSIECKTGNIVRKKDRLQSPEKPVRLSSLAADLMIYKTKALQMSVGGLRTKSIIVSLDEATDRQRARASENGIDIISGSEALANLSQRLVDSLGRRSS